MAEHRPYHAGHRNPQASPLHQKKLECISILQRTKCKSCLLCLSTTKGSLAILSNEHGRSSSSGSALTERKISECSLLMLTLEMEGRFHLVIGLAWTGRLAFVAIINHHFTFPSRNNSEANAVEEVRPPSWRDFLRSPAGYTPH